MSMESKPGKEHEWLGKFVGEWEFEGEGVMEEGKPPEKFSGTESVRRLGAFWILAEGQSGMPGGGTATMLLTLGYDDRKSRYVGTFVASMMDFMWLYDGGLDASGRVLTLDTQGPGFAKEGLSRFQDIHEFEGDDLRRLTSRILGEDGQWREVMRATYRRKS